MDVRIDSETLGRELGLISKVVARKPTIPILGNVLFTTVDGHLRMAATDLDIGLGSPCAGSIDKPGTMTLPALKLAEIVRSLPNTEIRLTLDGASAKVSGGKYRSKLQTLMADDYPAWPSQEELATRILPRAALKRLVSQVRCAITATPDGRFFIAGAQLIFNDGSIGMVATDSHRLAVATAQCESVKADSVLIPSKALLELAALLSEDGTGDVTLAAGENFLFFALDGRTLFARKVEGTFPAWERIMHKDNDHIATVNRKALLTSLRRVELVSGGSGRSVLFGLGHTEGMRLSASSATVSEADESLPADCVGEPVETRISGQYVADFLEAAEGETITMAVKDDVSQVLFSDGDGYKYVAMPIRL